MPRSIASLFVGLLNPETGRLAYVNAGHNPPLLVHAGGTTETLEPAGLCLGMFPAQAYEERRLALAPQDVLCLYTDGIVESRKAEVEEYGDARLAERVRELGGLKAAEILERIFDDVFSFSGCTEAGDDMTLVVIKRGE